MSAARDHPRASRAAAAGRRAAPADARRQARPVAPWALALWALALLTGSHAALAAGGSYATAGSGAYAQSLWWLDFTSYDNPTASGGAGQPFTFTLPNGAGTLTTTVKLNGTSTLAAVVEPAWAGGGAFGHGAYNGLSGNPILYWLTQTGTGTLTLSALVVRDTAGNARSFALYAADGENTNNAESIVYRSTAPWTLIDTVNYYASFNGDVPALAGVGTTTVAETKPTTIDGTFNASVVLATQNPTQVSTAFTGNEAALFAVSLPTVALTVSIAGRVSAADEFTASVAYTSPALAVASARTSGAGSSVSPGATAVIGTNSVTIAAAMVPGSPSALSYYTGAVACANSGPGAASWGGTATLLPAGAGTSFALTPQTGDAIACTLTLTPAAQTVAGAVYSDANHNSALDGGESGTGVAGLFIKLSRYSGGSCQNPALATAAVNAGGGAFLFPGVTPGNYCLTLTSSNGLANTTAYLPPGWLGTEAPTGVRQLTVTGAPAASQNFGLYNGSQLTAVVFVDSGAGGGSANDGVQNGGEPGLANVTVTASAGGSPVASATTSSGGAAVLWLPATISGTVTLTPAAPGGDLATGGSAGNTGGSYSRPSVGFTFASGASYAGVAFGLVAPGSLAPDGAESAQPGTTTYFPHVFTAATAGQVSFSTSAAANPAVAGWNETLYLDSACTGQYSSGDAPLTAPVAIVAGQLVCLLVKEFVPANAPLNATNKLTVTATVAYSGAAAPAASTLTRTDTVVVTSTGAMQLTKQVQNLTSGGGYGTSDSALPGNTLQYQITVANPSSGALSNVVVSDATAAFTTFVSASCPVPASLPSGLTSCSVALQPAVGGQGALQWSFTGSLAPGSQTAVTFQVQVAP